MKLKSKNYTTKQSIKRLEEVCSKLFIQQRMIMDEVGKIQKALAGYDIVSDEEESVYCQTKRCDKTSQCNECSLKELSEEEE